MRRSGHSIETKLTTMPVGELALKISSRASAGHGVEVYGEPMHATAAEMMSSLRDLGLDDFLRQTARYGVGNFVIVLRDGMRATVVTSPGYAGGYIRQGLREVAIATHLSSALAMVEEPIEAHPFGMAFYLSYAPSSNFNMLPFTTMFRDTRRLPGGALLELHGTSLKKFESYLNLPRLMPPPPSLQAALEETADAITTTAARNPSKTVLLLFSGGVVSSVLLALLRNRLAPERLRIVTLEASASNGPPRAVPVARALGVEIETMAAADLPTEAAEALQGMLAVDTPGFVGTHLLLAGQPDLLIVNGQLLDTLVNGNMQVPGNFHELGLFSDAGLRLVKTAEKVQRRDKSLIGNLVFTDAYLDDPHFQATSSAALAAETPHAQPDHAPGPDGVLRGIISRRIPNLVSPQRQPVKQGPALTAEISQFDRLIGKGVKTPRMRTDMMCFLAIAQIAHKRLAGAPFGPRSEIVLPAMSGPVLNYLLGRPRGLTEANQPKREIYAAFRALTGQAYRTAIKTQPDDPVWQAPPHRGLEMHPAFAAAAAVLDRAPTPNPLLAGLTDKKVRAYLENTISELQAKLAELRAGQPEAMNESHKNLLIRISNLLCVLDTAEKTKNTLNEGAP